MMRMEIALILVLVFVAFIYFGAGKRNTPLHKTFSVLLAVTPLHLAFDAATVYTVNHIETVPPFLNELLHRLFIGTMVIVVYLFYRYISILVEEETKKPVRFHLAAKIYLVLAELEVMILPVHYAVTAKGNYSDGIHVSVCYISTAFYLFLCLWLLLKNRTQIDEKKKAVIGMALIIEGIVSLLQAINPTWLISGMGITLMTLSFYLTLENPDILRAELTEQKMSMLYLKSQVNPHFLYNTLDTIRIQADFENSEERVISSITRYMQEHLSEEISLSVLADIFHLNPQYISQLFKNEIGVGFLSYLTNIRIEKAKKLLLSTSFSVTEISSYSGYSDYRVFTKVFKKTEGVTPSQFRREFWDREEAEK